MDEKQSEEFELLREAQQDVEQERQERIQEFIDEEFADSIEKPTSINYVATEVDLYLAMDRAHICADNVESFLCDNLTIMQDEEMFRLACIARRFLLELYSKYGAKVVDGKFPQS